MIFKSNLKKIFMDASWWGGVFGLIFLSQVRTEFLLLLVQESRLKVLFDPTLLQTNAITISTIISPARGILLLYSLAVLTSPIIRNIQLPENIGKVQFKGQHVLQVLLVFIGLCFIFSPGEIGGLAAEYSNTSLVMFTKTSTVSFHQRFLLPALANILFFRGKLFFLIFTFGCSLALVFILRYWFVANKISISLWQFLSLGSISFVYFQIQTPGYPDVLVGIFILLAFTFNLDTRAKLSLFVLSLASHEASLFVWFPFAFLLLERKGVTQFLMIGGVYISLLFAANGGISYLLAIRQVGETSNLLWVAGHPEREFLGIFMGLRGLWGIVFGAIIYLCARKRFMEVVQILAILSAGVLMTFLGVDTSRLFGWTFMAVLISWKILEYAEGGWKKIINFALIINILIPPVNVLLISNPSISPGLYQYIFNFLFA